VGDGLGGIGEEAGALDHDLHVLALPGIAPGSFSANTFTLPA
jgi:hypothetical protein